MSEIKLLTGGHKTNSLKVTQCKGEGQGSCKRCNDYGIWNRQWMCFLYEIEGYEDEKNGFSIQQQSSSSDQFAEWKFMKGLQAEEQLLAKPAVCIVHADERLKLNIQYEIVFLRGKILFLSEEKKYETGKIEIAIPN